MIVDGDMISIIWFTQTASICDREMYFALINFI